MSTDDPGASRKETETVRELSSLLAAQLPLLPDELRAWLEAHRTRPREVTVAADPDGARMTQVWLVTDHTADNDASSLVVYDPHTRMFGLVMELRNGVLWYSGPNGSLVETLQSI